MSYKHIFFDLDHTLWDHETNVYHTLRELFDHYQLDAKTGASKDDFHACYRRVNNLKWQLYGAGKITKEELRNSRFYDTFRELGLDDHPFSVEFERVFIETCPHQTALLPGAVEVLDYLLEKNYILHIITNGFAEIQDIKLSKSGLKPYFEQVVTSDKIGVNKPHARVFEESMRRAQTNSRESLMVGDNLEADVLGAQRIGMDQVFYNPGGIVHREKPTYEISHLEELKAIL